MLFYMDDRERRRDAPEIVREFLLTSDGKSNECAKILKSGLRTIFVKTIFVLFEHKINFHHEPARPSRSLTSNFSETRKDRNMKF